MPSWHNSKSNKRKLAQDHIRTHRLTPAHLQLGDGILQIPSHSSCGSRGRNQCAVFTPCGFGQNRQNLATATGGESYTPAPLLPSDLQLIILNKIEFAPLYCCKIIKHGTGLPNRCVDFGTAQLRFSFVGFGNNFVFRPCQVCRGFVPPPPSRLAALLLAAAYIIQLNSLPAHFVHAPQWQIVIVSQLCGNCNLHSPDNGFT